MADNSMWIVRYSEIALKGGNRAVFERALVGELQRRLRDCGKPRVRRTRGRIWVDDEPAYREQVRRELQLTRG